MNMRYFEARQHQPDARRLESSHLRPSDRLGYLCQVAEQIGVQVDPVIDLLSRDHQRVAGAQRAIGQENDTVVVLPHESRRQLAGDYAGETDRHRLEVRSYGVARPPDAEIGADTKEYGE